MFFLFLIMRICSRCGAEKLRLFDVVEGEGIIEVCSDCLDENIPVIKKPSKNVFDESNSQRSVYERLRDVAGIKSEKVNIKTDELIQQEEKLKELIKETLGGRACENLNPEVDLVRNFHWVIMRARRLKKLTLAELAKKLYESEESLSLLERGDASKTGCNLIKKIELFFGIILLTNEARKKFEVKFDADVSFDKIISQSLTIDDLREIKKEEEARVFGAPKEVLDEKVEKKSKSSEDLTQEEISDLIFGRK